MGLLSVCLLGSIGLQLYVPQIVRSFIDLASARAALDVLTRLALTYLGLSVVNQLLAASSTYLSADVGWRSTNALRADLFRHVLGLDMAYHKDRLPGEMIERIDGDVTSISNFFSQFVVRVSAAILLTGGVLVLLWREDWRVGLGLTLFTAFAMAVLHRRREVAVGPTQEEREMTAQVFGFVEERLTGVDDIRANGAGPYTMRRFLELQRHWFGKAARAWWLRSTIWISMNALFASGYILTLGLGIWLYHSGSASLGTVYLFFNYMAMLEAPLDQITQQLQEFQKAAAGIRRVRELMELAPHITSGPRQLPHRALAVEFADVRFHYARQEVLKGLSFRLEPGETLGLLGRTGSGKTTLIRLLCRLYDATDGHILLDGADIREASLETVRARVGLVTQDVQLFQGTIRDNLTFFDPRIDDARIWPVLEELELKAWVETLPAQLDTPIEAGGSGLSAGQGQLLALARVFLRDPGLVILDEPSSRLDPATERILNGAIDRLLKGRTGILIAHRLATVERAGKIMVLSEGRVLEYGPRAALAADPASRYSTLLRLSSETASLDQHLEQLL